MAKGSKGSGGKGKGASYNERSAKTGRFVKKGSEKRRPNTTVKEKR